MRLLKPLKILAFLVLVVTFLTISFAIDLVLRDRARKLGYFSKLSSFYMALALRVVGVSVSLKNADILKKREHGCFILCNHLSYLDVFTIFSTIPATFVANSELEKAFLLGTIIKYSGGIFVERKSRAKLLDDMRRIEDLLKMGLNVVLFPEGTTSDGTRVMPFKTSLLGAVEGSDALVLPLCIKYRFINGKKVTPQNGHLVYYYEEITFFAHFFRLLGLRSISAELTELEPFRASRGMSRKEMADIAHDRISAAYGAPETAQD